VIHNHHIGWDLKYERKARKSPTGGHPERMPIIRELEHLKQFEEIEKRIHAQMRNMLYAGFLLGCMLLALFGILLIHIAHDVF
jgi:hypothetical protein